MSFLTLQKAKIAIAALTVALVASVATILGLAVHPRPTSTDSAQSGSSTILPIYTTTKEPAVQQSLGLAEYGPVTRRFIMMRGSSSPLLQAEFGVEMGEVTATDCRRPGKDEICVIYAGNGIDQKLTITKVEYVTPDDINCYKVMHTEFKNFAGSVTHCYDYLDRPWYGAAEVNVQHWDMREWDIPMQEFIPRDPYYPGYYGSVLESYWLNAAGVSISVEHEIPLWASNNSTTKTVCFKAQIRDSVYQIPEPEIHLNYEICESENLTQLHQVMATRNWRKPKNHPDLNVLVKPIWSTWAEYKKNINASLLHEYADKIVSNNLSISQLEIDDNWTPKYGDWVFNTQKFPNAMQDIQTIKQSIPSVSVWIHPFVDIRADAFNETADLGHLVKVGETPGLVTWWNPGYVGVLDFTSTATKGWFLAKMLLLQQTYGIDSFKFDAGETVWLPKHSTLNRSFGSPAYYAKQYVETAYLADKDKLRQEVRVGFRTQEQPILVRMLDRRSHWGVDNGLRSVIPATLTFGLIGYTFVLPDMIGGNAYEGAVVDKELYIRWLQVNAFLPAIQFSIPPWRFDEETVDYTRQILALRESFSWLFEQLANESMSEGWPLVRPMWWIAPYDEQTYTISDQYLLGNNLMVAPVVAQGMSSRSIYIPDGIWMDMVHNRNETGPKWLDNVPVSLLTLPYYIKKS